MPTSHIADDAGDWSQSSGAFPAEQTFQVREEINFATRDAVGLHHHTHSPMPSRKVGKGWS
jgi:hypothetical protein